jgi:cytochrome c oxidase subunit IV
MAIYAEALSQAARATRSAAARLDVPGARLSPALMRRLAFMALCVVGIAEVAQTGAAFFGNEDLLWYHQDFPAFYTAAHLVTHGGGHLIYDTAAMAAAESEIAGHPVGGTGVLAYFNPPFFALAMAPLAWMSMDRAFQVWTIVSLALLAANAWMLWRIGATLSQPSRWLLVAGFLTLVPVSYGLQQGQFSLILATSWGATLLLLRNGHERWSGVALAPLLIKPELLLPVAAYLLWKRRWRVFSTLLPLTLAAVVISIVVVGPSSALAYPAYLSDSTRWDGAGVTSRLMFSWNGIVAMLWDHPGSWFSSVAFVSLSVPTLGAVAYAARGAFAPLAGHFAPQWLLLTVATILVDPHLYLQDTILVALPAAALLCSAPAGQRQCIAVAIAAGWATLALGTFPNEHLHVDLFGIYLVAAGVAVLVARSPYRKPASQRVRAGV